LTVLRFKLFKFYLKFYIYFSLCQFGSRQYWSGCSVNGDWKYNNRCQFHQHYTYEYFVRLRCISSYVLALLKNSYEKRARILLMKLTTGRSFSVKVCQIECTQINQGKYPVQNRHTNQRKIKTTMELRYISYVFWKFVFWQLWLVGCAGCTAFGCFRQTNLRKKCGQQFFSGPRYVVNPYCILSDNLERTYSTLEVVKKI